MPCHNLAMSWLNSKKCNDNENGKMYYWRISGINVYKPSGKGRAIAQAVSRWLPTAAARVRARVWSCGICGGQSGAGTGFFRVLRFPLPTFIPPIAPQSSSFIIWGLYNRPEVATVPSGLSPTLLRRTLRQLCSHNSPNQGKRMNKNHRDYDFFWGIA
jgi:hypothetical protein